MKDDFHMYYYNSINYLVFLEELSIIRNINLNLTNAFVLKKALTELKIYIKCHIIQIH